MRQKIDADALQTLSDLDHALRKHIQALLNIPCESDTAAEAITLAIGAAETALSHVREAKRQMFRSE